MTEYSKLQDSIGSMAKRARIASHSLALLSSEKKNSVLLGMARLLEQRMEYIQQENKKDLTAGREKGLSAAMLDRLELSEKVMQAMVAGLLAVTQLPDPVGEISANGKETQWVARWSYAYSFGCDCDDLRISSQCDC